MNADGDRVVLLEQEELEPVVGRNERSDAVEERVGGVVTLVIGVNELLEEVVLVRRLHELRLEVRRGHDDLPRWDSKHLLQEGVCIGGVLDHLGDEHDVIRLSPRKDRVEAREDRASHETLQLRDAFDRRVASVQLAREFSR